MEILQARTANVDYLLSLRHLSQTAATLWISTSSTELDAFLETFTHRRVFCLPALYSLCSPNANWLEKFPLCLETLCSFPFRELTTLIFRGLYSLFGTMIKKRKSINITVFYQPVVSPNIVPECKSMCYYHFQPISFLIIFLHSSLAKALTYFKWDGAFGAFEMILLYKWFLGIKVKIVGMWLVKWILTRGCFNGAVTACKNSHVYEICKNTPSPCICISNLGLSISSSDLMNSYNRPIIYLERNGGVSFVMWVSCLFFLFVPTIVLFFSWWEEASFLSTSCFLKTLSRPISCRQGAPWEM